MRKIRRYNEWQSMPYKEKTRYDEFERIKIMAHNSRIPKIIVDIALYYHKEISDEIHDRYLICPNQSYNIVSGDTARRGQVGDVSQCARPDIERWWESSYDIFEDWNKFQD